MRLLDLLKAAHTVNHITISHEARLDVLWQRAFLPLYNGENIMKPAVAERCCFVDACLSSAGGYSREHGFFKFTFPQHMQELQFCISALEAFNLLVVVRLWAPEWAGKNVIIYTDNWGSVCAINSGSAREPLLRSISRELWWQCAVHDIELTVRHRPGAMMEAADTLSRVDSHREFKEGLVRFEEAFGEPQRTLPPLYWLHPSLCNLASRVSRFTATYVFTPVQVFHRWHPPLYFLPR